MFNSALKLKHLSMEAINFQDGEFGKALETQFAYLQKLDASNSTKDFTKIAVDMLLLIEKYTGLHTTVTFIPGFNASVILPDLSFRKEMSELGKKFQETTSKKILEDLKEWKVKGGVDIKNSRVSGDFATNALVCKLYFGTGLIDPKAGFTPGELTALLLHEIGHIFTTLEYTTRMVMTNQALAAVSKSLLNKETQEQRNIVLKLAGKTLFENDHFFTGCEEIEDINTLSVVFMDRAMGKGFSELDSVAYDNTSSEYLADQFAIRHGYARELVFALERIGKFAMGTYSDKNVALMTKLQITFSITTAVMTPILIAFGFVGVSAMFLFSLLISVKKGSYANRTFTYDSHRVRYSRVKEDLIQRLKIKDIPKEVKDEILQNIDSIDEVMKTLSKNDETFYEKYLYSYQKEIKILKPSYSCKEIWKNSLQTIFLSLPQNSQP